MEVKPLEVFSEDSNFGVVRMPGRSYPGCVIQGETFHFDIVSMQSARALIDYSVQHRFPCGNGIITVDNEAQAWARARLTEQDKGGDAARAALALIAVKRQRAKK